ncbi:hypothetical protein FACS189456_3610 [Bacteroidia bacterium]|nr:hypothetical protein FACS189456_3610 [Bacteroidia bacterium]
MKKRLRKKLHKGEFAQTGISIAIPITLETVEDALQTITDIAERYKILFIGGGLGRFMLPSKEYGDLDIPKKTLKLIELVALSKDPLPDYILGHFVNPTGSNISADVTNKIESELKEVVGSNLQFIVNFDLWNY